MIAPALASIDYEKHRNGREKRQYRMDQILVPILLSLCCKEVQTDLERTHSLFALSRHLRTF